MAENQTEESAQAEEPGEISREEAGFASDEVEEVGPGPEGSEPVGEDPASLPDAED